MLNAFKNISLWVAGRFYSHETLVVLPCDILVLAEPRQSRDDRNEGPTRRAENFHPAYSWYAIVRRYDEEEYRPLTSIGGRD